MQSISPETQEFINLHRTENIRMLALRSNKHKEIDLPFALQQIEGWQIARHKLPLWSKTKGIIYPPHISMEQCSSEQTAEYKADIMGKGEIFADLTGGFGVDTSYLARGFKKAWYVERNEDLCQTARHNFQILELPQIEVCNKEAELFLKEMPPVDCLFIDPARRNEHGGKAVAISDCTPDVKTLLPLLLQKGRKIMIKLSPMLDISLALHNLPDVSDVHIIAINNECKELLLIIQHNREEESPVQYHSINLLSENKNQQFAFTQEEESLSTCTYATTIGNYLYEPNTAILKAGAFRSIAQRFHLEKLHPNSHLYTSETLERDFPGRSFIIEQAIGFTKKDLKALQSSVKKANLAIRNFPSSVAELRKRLKLQDGGETYLFATTLANEKKILLKCKKISAE